MRLEARTMCKVFCVHSFSGIHVKEFCQQFHRRLRADVNRLHKRDYESREELEREFSDTGRLPANIFPRIPQHLKHPIPSTRDE